MKALSKSDKLISFIAPKMKNLITLLKNKGNFAVYIGVNIHGIYRYLKIIGAPTTLTTSGQKSHHFVPSYFINNHTETLQTVIVAIRMIQKSIF